MLGLFEKGDYGIDVLSGDPVRKLGRGDWPFAVGHDGPEKLRPRGQPSFRRADPPLLDGVSHELRADHLITVLCHLPEHLEEEVVEARDDPLETLP